MFVLFFSLIISLTIFVYFLPTIIAFVRNKRNKIGILILNLFLGMTFIFWVIALVWSALEEDKN